MNDIQKFSVRFFVVILMATIVVGPIIPLNANVSLKDDLMVTTFSIAQDVAGPTITIYNPTDGSVKDGSYDGWQVFATAEDSSGVAWIQLLFNGTEYVNVTTSPLNERVKRHELAGDGYYNLSVVAADTVGNIAMEEMTIILDTTDPVITSFPSDVEFTIGTLGHTLEWIVEDLTPSEVHIIVDYETTTVLDYESGVPIVFSLDTLGVGVHEIHFVAYDELGYPGYTTHYSVAEEFFETDPTVTVLPSETTSPTTDDSTTTTSSPTESTTPTSTDNPTSLYVSVAMVGVGAIIVVIVVIFVKRK